MLDCCVGVVEALKFPQYRGAKVERDLPFTWRKTEVRKQIEIWDAQPSPSQP